MRKPSIKLVLSLLFSLSTLGLISQVPDNLTSSRSAVVISIPETVSDGFIKRGDWKKMAKEAHRSFKKIGVDGVVYIYKDDLSAGPEVHNAYMEILDKREIENIVSLKVSGSGYDFNYELDIYPINGKVDLNKSFYHISSKSTNELMLILGRQVLRQETARTNFLIPDEPEFLDDLVLYDGIRYVNVPSRLKSLKLAVAMFDSLDIPDNLSELDKKQLISKNQQISMANQELKRIMSKYPFKYELINFKSVEECYKKGYQYVLMPIISSGQTIKQMLNYNSNSNETVYVTEVSKKGQKPVLKRIPSTGNMTKFYIKQTIAKDIHVGKYWDADVTWQKSLENFIDNLKFDFNIK
ncbi:MAG: hypothetical protein JXR03_15135 [Cyclobacteriaceae bacterium]